jgi:hypothetical protein
MKKKMDSDGLIMITNKVINCWENEPEWPEKIIWNASWRCSLGVYLFYEETWVLRRFVARIKIDVILREIKWH